MLLEFLLACGSGANKRETNSLKTFSSKSINSWWLLQHNQEKADFTKLYLIWIQDYKIRIWKNIFFHYYLNLFICCKKIENKSLSCAEYFFLQNDIILSVRRQVPAIIALMSCLFMKRDWLHLTCFSFIGAWILSTFEEMHLNFSNFLGRKFWKDNSWRRYALNVALSKWLKSLYWMILGLCI